LVTSLEYSESSIQDKTALRQSIYVVIPVHNRVQYTRSCLISLRQQTVFGFEIIVIDDGSTDGTSEMIETEFPEVVLLRGDGNLWWTRAINIGVEYALAHKADYIMTLNDDIVPHANFIEQMMFHATKNPDALLGGLEIDSITKKPTYGGMVIDWKLAKYRSILDTLALENRHGLHGVDHLPGRELLIPTGAFYRIGLFDEKTFPHTVADFDFTCRAYQSGYKIYCNYDARVEVYRDTQGGLEYRKHKSLRNYYNHLFGFKGKGNLIRFIHFGLKNCPKQFLLTFLCIGVSRRVCGYLMEWIKESINLLHEADRPKS